MSEGLDRATNTVRQFLETAEAEIEAALAEGKPLPATKLAERIGPQFGMDMQQGYHILCVYIDARKTELDVKKGKGGGIVRRKPETPPEVKKE